MDSEGKTIYKINKTKIIIINKKCVNLIDFVNSFIFFYLFCVRFIFNTHKYITFIYLSYISKYVE